MRFFLSKKQKEAIAEEERKRKQDKADEKLFNIPKDAPRWTGKTIRDPRLMIK